MVVDVSTVIGAIERDEVRPCFQPIVEIRTGRITGFEVLARWEHPELGLVLPQNFIALAERSGLIGQLTQQVVRRAFRVLPTLPPGVELSINISPVQLAYRTLPSQIGAMASEAGFPLERLVLEITESAFIDNLDRAQIILQDLKSLGCTLALDDFGTGYSSLRYLHQLPFDKLKVDMSFVRTMTNTREGRKVVASIVGLGHSLGMTAVAEGIETKEQAEILLWLGCEMGQGWLYGRGLPEEHVAEMVARTPRQLVPTVDAQGLTSLEALPAQRLAQLQAIYDGAPVGLGFVDAKLRYVSINARLAALNGVPIAETLGRPVSEVIPGSYPRLEPYLKRALAGEAVMEATVTRSSELPDVPDWTALLSYQPALDEAGEVIGVSLAVLDITDRQRSEEALRKSAAQLGAISDAVPLGIFFADSSGRVTNVNREAKRIHSDPLPLPAAAIKYTEFGLKDTGGSQVSWTDYPLARALIDGEPDRKLMVRKREDGTQLLLDVWGLPVRGGDGELLGAMAIVKDIDAAYRMRQLLMDTVAQLKLLLGNAVEQQQAMRKR